MFLHPLGLLSLFAVPAIVALHLFRRRFRPRAISALYLWVDDDHTPLAGRRRERLRTNASFWLEVLGALALGLVFAGPRACGSGQAEHLVCVLDASASMSARGDDGTARERAIEFVRERIDALAARSRVTLIASGPRPRLVAGPAAFPAEASGLLDEYRASAARHDLGPAVALGLQLSGDGALLVVTDRFEPGRFPDAVELVSVGRARDNVAITHATRARSKDADTDTVLVTVTALTAEPVTTELSIASSDTLLERTTLELEPDTRRHFSFSIPEDSGPITVSLPGDALEIDDRAFLAPVPPRVVSLATTLDERATRVLGLASGRGPSHIDRWLELVPESVEAPSPALAHVLIGDPTDGGARTWSLSIETGGHAGEPADLIGPFLAQRDHPLLSGTTLRGIIWSAASEHRPLGVPVVSAGDLTLMTEEVGAASEGRRVFRMNFEPERSSLQSSPDWPILLANLAELRRAELPGPVRSNIAVGAAFEYRTRTPGTFSVRALDRLSETLEIPARDVLVVEDLPRPGLYAVESGGAELCRFGVSFEDPEESDLRELEPGRRAPDAALSSTLAAFGPLETGLSALGILALLLDWWVLRRMGRRPELEEGE